MQVLKNANSLRYDISKILFGNKRFKEINKLSAKLLEFNKLLNSTANAVDTSMIFYKLLNDGIFKAPMINFADRLMETKENGNGIFVLFFFNFFFTFLFSCNV